MSWRVFVYRDTPNYWPATATVYVFQSNGTVKEYITDAGGGATLVAGGGSGGGASNAIENTTTSIGITYVEGENTTVFCNGAGITITLPTAVGNRNYYTVINEGTSTVTVAFTGGQTCLGSSTVTLPIQNMSLTFISNNTNWAIS